MKKYSFYWSFEGNAILLRGIINGEHPITFLFDTGASNTSVDFNTLALVGYNFVEPIDKVLIETANGVISTNVYSMKLVETLGIQQENFPVQIIDFLQRGITSEYDGILGLDFLQGTHFCIDTLNNEIIIH